MPPYLRRGTVGEDQKDEEVSYKFGSDRLSSFLAALLFEGLRLGFGIAAAAAAVVVVAVAVAVDEVDEVDCSAAAAAAVVGGIVDAAEVALLLLLPLPDVFGVVVCDGL